MNFNKPSKEDIELLVSFYGQEFMDSVKAVKGKEKLFIFYSPSDYEELTQEQVEVLFQLELEEELHNPIFVEIEDGVLCVE